MKLVFALNRLLSIVVIVRGSLECNLEEAYTVGIVYSVNIFLIFM